MKNYPIIFSFLLMNCQPMSAQTLDDYEWKNRVLLLFTPDAQQIVYQQQLALFREDEEGLKERDLVIFHVFATEGQDPKGEALSQEDITTLRNTYAKDTPMLQIVLIGKDGGKKLYKRGKLPLETLYSTIDAMPMRRAETRKEKGK